MIAFDGKDLRLVVCNVYFDTSMVLTCDKDKWNQFDFIVVLVSIIAEIAA